MPDAPHIRPGGSGVANGQSTRFWLVISLSGAFFLLRTVWMMMGILLVALAATFETSLAAAGQLAAAIGISWGITAPLVGPLSDTYGRRRVALTGVALAAVGTLGSVIAWNYWALLACRLITGFGGAMIPPNSMATIADHFPPADRGRPIGILLAASFFALVIGTPTVAFLGETGGWRLPFAVIGGLFVLVWVLQWYTFQEGQPTTRPSGFAVHFKEVGRRPSIWFVLLANVLYQTAAIAMFTYLVAFLVQTYAMSQGSTVLPLALVGSGAMFGSLLGGYLADRRQRLRQAALALVLGGGCVSLALTAALSPWAATLWCCAGALLLTIFEPVTWVLTAELAGESRATANGLLATSNQLGIIGGASAGGAFLALGGFPLVGFFCLAAATAAAVVVIGIGMGLKTRSTQAVRL
jgi:DHA1 family inner membrane transport protein